MSLKTEELIWILSVIIFSRYLQKSYNLQKSRMSCSINKVKVKCESATFYCTFAQKEIMFPALKILINTPELVDPFNSSTSRPSRWSRTSPVWYRSRWKHLRRAVGSRLVTSSLIPSRTGGGGGGRGFVSMATTHHSYHDGMEKPRTWKGSF